jgi:hypothetical protein
MIGLEDLIDFSAINAHDRMTILAVAAAVLLFCLIIVLCKICPGCSQRSGCPMGAKYPYDSDYDDIGRYWGNLVRRLLSHFK